MNNAYRRVHDIAQAVNERIPQGFGFVVLIWPLGESGKYIHTTNDPAKSDEILARAGIGPVNRPPREFFGQQIDPDSF